MGSGQNKKRQKTDAVDERDPSLFRRDVRVWSVGSVAFLYLHKDVYYSFYSLQTKRTAVSYPSTSRNASIWDWMIRSDFAIVYLQRTSTINMQTLIKRHPQNYLRISVVASLAIKRTGYSICACLYYTYLKLNSSNGCIDSHQSDGKHINIILYTRKISNNDIIPRTSALYFVFDRIGLQQFLQLHYFTIIGIQSFHSNYQCRS